MGRAQPHEFTTGIGEFEHRADWTLLEAQLCGQLGLGLGWRAHQERNKKRG
jgi:hypothetical protein